MRYVSIIHVTIGSSTLACARSVPLLGIGTINILNAKYVTSLEFKLLLFHGSSTLNIVDIHLVTYKLSLLWLFKCNALQIVIWIQRVSP